MENYEIVNHIGKGSFGLVSKVKRKSDGKILVWKELNYGRMSEKEKQQLVSEVNILRELRHANIVRYYDRIIDKKMMKIYIIMEYCEGGDMGSLIKKCKKDRDYIAEDVIWKVFTQILLALNDCHNRKSGKILHRDLKPANIFLDGQSNIKLGDFGLARVMGEQSVFAYTHVGTPYYMSPEQINESQYDEKSDIWSAGCLLYEIAALRPPFEASNHLSLALKIKTGKFERLPIRYSDDLQKIIEMMLNTNPKRRLGVEELLKTPQIAMRIKEKNIREKLSAIKQTETELVKREEDLRILELSLNRKEDELRQMEQRIQEYERRVGQANEVKNLRINTMNDENVIPEIYSGVPTTSRHSVREKSMDFDFENLSSRKFGNANGNGTKRGLIRANTLNFKTYNNELSNYETRGKKVLGDISNLVKL